MESLKVVVLKVKVEEALLPALDSIDSVGWRDLPKRGSLMKKEMPASAKKMVQPHYIHAHRYM